MTFAEQLRQEGFQESYQESFQAGLQQGRREEALAIAHTMLEHGMTLATIQQFICLPEEELRSLEEALPIL